VGCLLFDVFIPIRPLYGSYWGTVNALLMFTVKPYVSDITVAAESEVFHNQAYFMLMLEILQYVECLSL
jgi:hypothetical protein